MWFGRGRKKKSEANAPETDAEAGDVATNAPGKPPAQSGSASAPASAAEDATAPLLAEVDSASDGAPPFATFIPYWPLSPLIILVLITSLILFSQTKKSMALKYQDEYYAKLTVASGYKTASYTGSGGGIYAYNIWEAVAKLWGDKAYVLSIFVAAWSGTWPYVKLIILGVGIAIYRNAPLPRSFDWLSTIAHYSYIDIWMVLISAAALKFDYSGTDSESEEVDLIEIKVNVDLDLWFQSYAEHGAYYFIAAIGLSQILGYGIIKCAQQPFAYRGPLSIVGETGCFGFDKSRSLCKKWDLGVLWYLPAYLAVIGVLLGIIIFMWNSMRTNIFKAIYNFDVSYTVDETEDSITFDKTFTFEKESSTAFSVFSCISKVVYTYGDIDASANEPLSYVSTYLLCVFPIMRLSFIAAAWAVPLSLQLHRIMLICIEVLGLFANFDAFCIAFVIMILFNELERIYKEGLEGKSGGGYTKDLDMTVEHLFPGAVYLIFATLLENAAVYGTLLAYREYLSAFDLKMAKKKASSDATTRNTGSNTTAGER